MKNVERYVSPSLVNQFVIVVGLGLAVLPCQAATSAGSNADAAVENTDRAWPVAVLGCLTSPGADAPEADGRSGCSTVQSPGNAASTKPETVVATSVYTCPMHSEVVAERPGDCSVCGMHLKLATAE